MIAFTEFKKLWCALFFILVYSSFFVLNAQAVADTSQAVLPKNSFSISTQFRPRAEFRYGAFRPMNKGEKPAALVSERLRLSLEYSYKDLLTLRIAPQNVSVWGQANMVQGAENNGTKFALFEAWVQLNVASWNFKVGRQIISLDDERFFGELDWAQGGRVHDAVSINFNKNDYEVRGFFAYNQNYKTLYANNLSNPSGDLYAITDAFPYKWMQTVWAAFPLTQKSKITLLATNLGFQNADSAGASARTYFSQTFGANFSHKGEKIYAGAAAYYQRGENVLGVSSNAYMASASLGYNINPNWDISIGSDIVSGNDVGRAAKHNMFFNPYFHTGHKFYGYMDYYYSGNPHKSAGLSDSYLKVNFKTQKGHAFNFAFHQFATPNYIANATETLSKNLGQEFDLTFLYKINKFIGVTGGYSFYLTNSSINFLKATPTAGVYQQWAWLALNVSPTLFKTKF